MKRLISNLTNISCFMLCLSLVLFPLSYSFNLAEWDQETRHFLSPHSVPVYTNVRCTAVRGSMWLFSNEIPYTGSIRYFINSDGRILYGHGRSAEKEERWRWQLGAYGMVQFRYTAEDGSVAGVDTCGDLPGVYYRHFDWSMDPWPWWTMRFSLVYLILLFGCLPGIRLICTIKSRTKR